MKTLVELVGEQPTPNLIVVKYLQPREVILIVTENKAVKEVAERLEKVIKENSKGANSPCLKFLEMPDAYNIPDILQKLEAYIKDNKINKENLIFNITGGTKPMSIAAWSLAGKLGIECAYLQSEGGKSLLHTCRFPEGKLQPVQESPREIPSKITLDEYIKSHFGDYTAKEPENPAEISIVNALAENVCELMTSIRPKTHNVEIDLMFRYGNQVGIAEVKTGGKARGKDPIDQLSTLSDTRLSGAYIKKFLFLSEEQEENNKRLAENLRIKTVVLKSLAQEGSNELSEDDKQLLINEVTSTFHRGDA